jgi:hypothetical protein
MSGTATTIAVLDGIIAGIIRTEQLRQVVERMKLEGRTDFNQADLDHLAGQSKQAIVDFGDAIRAGIVTASSAPKVP